MAKSIVTSPSSATFGRLEKKSIELGVGQAVPDNVRHSLTYGNWFVFSRLGDSPGFQAHRTRAIAQTAIATSFDDLQRLPRRIVVLFIAWIKIFIGQSDIEFDFGVDVPLQKHRFFTGFFWP